LTSKLKEYVTDAVVRVRIVNFKITILGETGSQVIQVPDERISVPQAIAMAGDITYDGKRHNILVIRNHEGKLNYERVDLTQSSIFQNPYYYLKQNDIVYVEPTYRKVKSAGFITSWQGLVSILTTAFSLFILFSR
ncbi:polysaccharide biosynthesis/export family protein, partial [Longispora fulva]|uniref:polysaccharide biosynthesis/export family protein n=2 Tax=Bacteria TaxID=2 RepID=UPI00363239EF